MLLSGLGQAITTTISSGFACRAVCGNSSSGERIIYVPRDNNQDIVSGNGLDGATALTGTVFIWIAITSLQFIWKMTILTWETVFQLLFLDNPPTYQEALAGCATSTQSKTETPEEVDLSL